MNTNGHAPAGLVADPAHIIPAPPPAPTPQNTQPVQQAQMPTQPPMAAAQPQPAAVQPTPQIIVQPRRTIRGWLAEKPSRQHGTIVAGLVTCALALPAYRWVTKPDTPAAIDPHIATLTSQVDALTAQLAVATKPEPLEVNPLSVLPCAVTNDARRFIGVNADGSLNLAQSERIARAVQSAFMQGSTDYTKFIIRTGQSVTQLEVDTKGRGVQLFDCGQPATPTPTTAATTPTTGGR